MTRHLLTCTALLLTLGLLGCAGAGQEQVQMDDTTDAQPPDPGAATDPPAATGPPAATAPTDTSPAGTSPSGALPPDVAQSVLGDHLEDWWVWLEMPWDDPFLPRCDQLEGAQEACARARTLAGTALAGELAVLGPYELEEPSLELLAQGLSQLVLVLPDEATAEEMLQTLREVFTGWGATSEDLPLGESAWTADHHDTAPGGFGEIDPDLVTRMVAVREGPSVVVLTHAEYPDDPRLDTEPIAGDIARRLAEAQ